MSWPHSPGRGRTARLLLLAAASAAGGCGDLFHSEFGTQAYATIGGTAVLSDGRPFYGELFVTFLGHGEVHPAATPGRYRIELSPRLSGPLPDSAVTVRVRFGGGPSDSVKVRFSRTRDARQYHRLDFRER